MEFQNFPEFERQVNYSLKVLSHNSSAPIIDPIQYEWTESSPARGERVRVFEVYGVSSKGRTMQIQDVREAQC